MSVIPIILLTVNFMGGIGDGGPSSPKEEFQALKRELDLAREDLARSTKDARTDSERGLLGDAYRSRARAIAAQALELARENRGNPTGFDALIWVNDEVRYDADKALDALRTDYIGSERLIAACRSAGRAPEDAFEAAECLLRTAIQESPHRDVRGLACFNLARRLKERAEKVRRLVRRPETRASYAEGSGLGAAGLERFLARAPEDLVREAASLYDTTIESYGDVKTLRAASLGVIAAGELSELRNLSIGKVAPDIDGRDVEGHAFKLSDYRGKVVVLTFGGEWCGGCRAMYPLEREIVAERSGERFALLSVNTDNEKEALRKAIASGQITWRCWWDGGTDGPITTTWGVESFPTIYIIDAKGVIRFKGLRGEELKRSIAVLLKEIVP